MTTIDDAAEVIGRYVHPDFAEDAARDLAAEGHLTLDQTIIRTVEELRELDPDTLLIRRQTEWDMHVPLCAQDWKDDWSICPDGIFPLAIIAPGEQVRAARKALEKETE